MEFCKIKTFMGEISKNKQRRCVGIEFKCDELIYIVLYMNTRRMKAKVRVE